MRHLFSLPLLLPNARSHSTATSALILKVPRNACVYRSIATMDLQPVWG